MTTRMEAMRAAKRAARVAVEAAERAAFACKAMKDDKGASMWTYAASHARDAEQWLTREIHATPEFWDEVVGEVAP